MRRYRHVIGNWWIDDEGLGAVRGLAIGLLLSIVIVAMLLFLVGCEQPAALHSVEGHFYFVPARQSLRLDDGTWIITEYPGAWISDDLLEEMRLLKVESLK